METSLKTGFAQIFSRCPKNLSCPKFGGAAAPLAPSARTPMEFSTGDFSNIQITPTKIDYPFLAKYICTQYRQPQLAYFRSTESVSRAL